jgi:hypothetical protein
MPIAEHYKGEGSKVMKSMKERYGAEDGKRVFYATENKQKSKKKNRKSTGKRG